MAKITTQKLAQYSQWMTWACIVHCFGSVILTALAPSLIKHLPHSWLIEVAVAVVAAISSAVVLKRSTLWKWALIPWTANLVFLLWAISLHHHSYFAWALLSLASIQLILSIQHHFYDHNKNPKNCNHCHNTNDSK